MTEGPVRESRLATTVEHDAEAPAFSRAMLGSAEIRTSAGDPGGGAVLDTQPTIFTALDDPDPGA